MEQLQNLIDPVSSFLWGWLLIYVLLATGLYFSLRTRLVQFRRFGHLWCLVFSSRGGAQGGISSFRAGPAFYIERGLCAFRRCIPRCADSRPAMLQTQ